MKERKVIRRSMALLTSLVVASTVFAGCGSTSSTNASKSTAAKTTGPLKIDVLSKAANYQGEQKGWFGQVIKKKFDLTLNILAPQVSGDSLYKTRAAAGNLGDLLVIDNADLKDCISAGLVMDLTDQLKDYPNLKKYYEQCKVFNSTFDKKVNPKGLIYAMPTNMAGTSPTTYSQTTAYSSPMLPWDYYTGIGAPKMDNLNDLLGVLKKMQDAYPKNADGKPTRAITLWKDWDNYMMENARWLCNWYGYEEPAETSTVLINAAGKIDPITNDDGMYKKILKFYYDANKMGLVDPDSASQDWNKVNEKLTSKQVLLLWYNWETGFYNTIERGKKKDGHIMVPISDMHIIQDSDSYYGDGRVYAIGSKAKDPKRILEFLDWFVSPEGLRYYADGIEGFNYVKDSNGKFKMTEAGQTAFQKNTPVPAEYGGGGYQDGQCKINIMLGSDYTKDPATGELYNNNYWSSTIEANKTALNNEWSQKYSATDPIDYLKKNKMIDIVPNINASTGTDSSDIKNKRSQCKQLVLNTSWKMVFAKNDAEFNQLWSKMKTDLVGLGWNDLVTADTERCKTLVDLRTKAVSEAKSK